MRQSLLRLWTGWKLFARRIGDFQARIILTLLYFLLVAPLAILTRPFSDPLRLREKRKPSYWLPRHQVPTSLEEGRRQ